MRGMRHPLTGALYELERPGLVRVADGDQCGIFDGDGRWVSGDRFSVCPNLCGWIGRGPTDPTELSQHRRFRNIAQPRPTEETA